MYPKEWNEEPEEVDSVPAPEDVPSRPISAFLAAKVMVGQLVSGN
jgi:hypothetical protein